MTLLRTLTVSAAAAATLLTTTPAHAATDGRLASLERQPGCHTTVEYERTGTATMLESDGRAVACTDVHIVEVFYRGPAGLTPNMTLATRSARAGKVCQAQYTKFTGRAPRDNDFWIWSSFPAPGVEHARYGDTVSCVLFSLGPDRDTYVPLPRRSLAKA